MLNDVLVPMCLYILGSVITWLFCRSHYERVRARAESMDDKYRGIWKQINELSTDIDIRSRIQAYKLCFCMYDTFTSEMLKDLPKEVIEEIMKKDEGTDQSRD